MCLFLKINAYFHSWIGINKINVRKRETQYKKLQLLFGTELFNVGYALSRNKPTATIDILKDLNKPNPLIK